MCRWFAHGRQHQQRQWAEGNRHTQMVHSTHQQCRWVELWEMFSSFCHMTNSWFFFLFAELHYCTGAYRISPVDVNSRPSSCLTNFLLNGVCAQSLCPTMYFFLVSLINIFGNRKREVGIWNCGSTCFIVHFPFVLGLPRSVCATRAAPQVRV